MSKRRKEGDRVRRLPGSGFAMYPDNSLLRISAGSPDPCFLCDDSECQEWLNLEVIEGRDAHEFFYYHISECQLVDP